MAQQPSQALDDGQPQPQPAATLARRVADLMILVEHCLQLGRGDADAGVPDLDQQRGALPAAAQQHPAAFGILDRVRQQVAQHLLQQPRVGADRRAARHDAQREALRPGMESELAVQPVQQRPDAALHHLGLHDASLDLVQVQQGVQHAGHGAQGFVQACDQPDGLVARDGPGQQPLQQRQRLQRLAQVVAGRGQEAGLGEVGRIGPLLCLL